MWAWLYAISFMSGGSGDGLQGELAVCHDVTFSGVSNEYSTSDSIEVFLKPAGPNGYQLSRQDWVGLFLEDAEKPREFLAMGYPEEQQPSTSAKTADNTFWRVVIPSGQLPRNPKPNTGYKLWYIDSANTVREVSTSFLLTKTTCDTSVVVVSVEEDQLPEQKSSSQESLMSSFVTVSDDEGVEPTAAGDEFTKPLYHHTQGTAVSEQDQEIAREQPETEGKEVEPLDSRTRQPGFSAQPSPVVTEDLPSSTEYEGASPALEQAGITNLSQSVVLVDHISQAEAKSLKKRNRDLVMKNKKLNEKLTEVKMQAEKLETKLKEYETMSENVSDKETEVERLHHMLEEKRCQVADLQSQVESQQNIGIQKERQIVYLQSKVDSLSRHSQSLAKTIQTLQSQVRVLQNEIAVLSEKNKVDTTQHSGIGFPPFYTGEASRDMQSSKTSSSPLPQHAATSPEHSPTPSPPTSPSPKPSPPPSPPTSTSYEQSPRPTPRPRKQQQSGNPIVVQQKNKAGKDVRGYNAQDEDVACPICGLVLPAHKSQYAITLHVEGCLKKKGYT